MTSRKWPLLASLALFAIGGFILFGPLVHIFNLHLLHDISRNKSGLVAPLLGLLFIYLGITIPRGFRATLYIASGVVVSGILFCLTNIVYRPTVSIVILTLLFGLAACTLLPLYTRPHMRSRVANNWYSIAAFLVVGGAGLLYGAFGFMALGPTAFHTPRPTLLQGLQETVETMLLPNELVDAPTHSAQLFIASLDAVGFIIVGLLLGVLIQPMKLRLPSSPHDRRDLERLLRTYPTDADDYFKLWPQPKRYFFSPSRKSCITFLPARQSLFILGNPNGDPKEFPELIRNFTRYTHEHGWTRCVIMPNDKVVRTYKANSRALRTVTLGTEATVSIPEFIRSTVRNKHFRYVKNKAERDGLTVEELSTIDAATLKKLKHISDEWLRNGRREYTFFMGHFSADYLRASRVFVLKHKGQWIAYASLLPTYDTAIASVDHFRFVADMPSTGMHFLLSTILARIYKDGVTTFNLGLAPLAHTKNKGDTPRLVRIAKRLSGRYYSFDGVAQFKGKFEPTWKKAVVLYEGSPLAIPGMISEFESISSYSRRLGRLVPLISAVAVILVVTATIYVAAQ